MYRVAIFIDGGYIDKVLEHACGNVRIDYRLLADTICKTIHPDADIFRVYYYHCQPWQSSSPTPDESARFAAKQNFFDAINRLPRFAVKLGRLARRGPDNQGKYSYEQKMVDVLLSIDLTHFSAKGQITHAAIVGGDSDFVPAIQVAQNEGISIWLFHGQRPHRELWDTADERIQINPAFVKPILWTG